MSSTRANTRTTGSGPEVILLHSSGSSGRQWDPLVSRMHGRFRLHAVDLHGHGGTPAWSDRRRLRLEDDAALVVPLLHAAGGAHLVGHSYGGGLALKLAAMYPSQVRSVVAYEPVLFRLLFDYHPRERASTEVTIAAASIRNWLERGDPQRSAQRFVDFWSGDGTWSAMAVAHREVIAARMPAVVGHFHALFNDTLARADLTRLHMPVLCLTGARTRLATRRISELLHFSMPNARHATLPETGHMGPITHAAVVTDRIARFLDGQATQAGNDAFARAVA
jgi:pimeloyl-ACP methyl ester carboxylesterase